MELEAPLASFPRHMMLSKDTKLLLTIYFSAGPKSVSEVLDTLLHPIPKSVKHVMTAEAQRNISLVQEQEGPEGKFTDLLNSLSLQIQL